MNRFLIDENLPQSLVTRLPSIGLRVLNVSIHDCVPGLERPVVSVLGITSRVP